MTKHQFKVLIQNHNKEHLFDNCCLCGWADSTVDLAHIISKASGGQYELDNIVPLCPNCHRLFDSNNLMAHQLEKIINFFNYYLYDIERTGDDD